MNATSNTTNDMDTNNNPWVESGAMVYVAITVATMSAVIMCCTWFITHNTALQRWWRGKANYNGIDGEEEEIELIVEPQKEGESQKETGYTDDEQQESVDDAGGTTNVFTLEDSGSDGSDSDGVNGQIEAV